MGELEEDAADSGDLTATRVLSAPSPHITGRWRLKAEVVGGAMDGLRTATTGSRLAIGRGAENDMVLTLDPAVSAQHARLVREGERYWLEDLGSRNGTFLGSQRVYGRVPIGTGTTFTVGRTLLEVLDG
jgi:hypothetical protein